MAAFSFTLGAPQFVGIGLFILGVILTIFGFRTMKKFRLIQDVPTSKIRSMAQGLVEVNGSVSSNKYLVTPFSGEQCIYYRFQVQQLREYTSTDSKGNTTRNRRWVTVAQGSRSVPFIIADETGKAAVDPRGADFRVKLKKQFLDRHGVSFLGGAVRVNLGNFTGMQQVLNPRNLQEIDITKRFRPGGMVGDCMYYEYFISPNDRAYVMGTATPTGNASVIKRGEAEKTFIVADRSEKELLGSLRWSMIGLLFFSFATVAGGIALFLLVGG